MLMSKTDPGELTEVENGMRLNALDLINQRILKLRQRHPDVAFDELVTQLTEEDRWQCEVTINPSLASINHKVQGVTLK